MLLNTQIKITVIFLSLLLCFRLPAQKVGLVLSGGGASGMCHVGVLKALEENQIPIDYITGTSIGGLIGAYYACGYSPAQIELIVKTYYFQSILRGNLPAKYEYMIKKREDYAGWISLKYDFKDDILKNLPTNVINSIPIDYYLMETFTGASNKVNRNYDSLFVPFRCVAADVENKKSIVFSNGDLPSAIRASMSYPFYLSPISIEGKLLFDGGLYNNFPADIMIQDFHPDFIIGSNVAEKNVRPNEDNLYLQLRSLLTSQTNFDTIGDKGMLIEPWNEVGTFNFDNVQRLIDSGYASTMRIIPHLKTHIKQNSDTAALNKKRRVFASYQKFDDTKFVRLDIVGFNKKQESFISKSLFYKSEPFHLLQLKKRYFRLVSDDKIRKLFPVAILDSATKQSSLKLIGKQEKPFYIEPGIIVSNRPISEAFLGLQYNHLGRIGFSAYVNGYLGKLNTSSYSHLRFDIPGRIPFFIQPSFTISRWDYYSTSILFYNFEKPAYLIQNDKFGEIKIGMPVGNISQVNLSGGYTELKNQYYQTDQFTENDTTDVSYFDYAYIQACYKINTLNRKMYASEGTYLNLRAKYVSGRESYYPGNTSGDTNSFKNVGLAPWIQLKLTFDSYIKTFKVFKIGVFLEGVYSTQPFFTNYKATILSAPAFNPTPESQTFFIDAYRTFNYAAGGLKAIFSPTKHIDFRVEAYIFQPYQAILSNSKGKAEFSTPFLYQYFAGTATLVYNTAIGPVSIGMNYYDQSKYTFSPFFHIGYIIFNHKSID